MIVYCNKVIATAITDVFFPFQVVFLHGLGDTGLVMELNLVLVFIMYVVTFSEMDGAACCARYSSLMSK